MKKGKLIVNYCQLENKEEVRNIIAAERHITFQMMDLLSSDHDYVIEISEISVDNNSRRTGFGSKILQDFCRGNDDNIIIVKAGALVSEYEDEPSVEEYDKLFEELTQFYGHNNFEDVTQLFGTYDGTTSRTFLCKNTAGVAAIEKQKKYVEEWEKNRNK